MQIIKPMATHMPHNCTSEQFIERIGRTCYKSEDKITNESASRFVAGLIKSRHWAMLEHEIIYMILTPGVMDSFCNDLRYMNISTEFLDFTCIKNSPYNVMSGNIRAFYDIFDQYVNSPDKGESHIPIDYVIALVKASYPWGFEGIPMPVSIQHLDLTKAPENRILLRDEFIDTFKDNPTVLFRHLNHTVRFTVDRGVTHELCRHRKVAYAMESTRYCNYSKGKFGNELTVIEPLFYKDSPEDYEIWKRGCEQDEKIYFELTDRENNPRTAQEARDNLPHSIKADLIMTTTEEEWQHIVNLRAIGTTGAPHPQAKEAVDLWAKQLVDITNGRVKYI